MKILIGIQNTSREISIDSAQKATAVRKIITAAYDSEDTKLLTLTDAKDREYFVPLDSISYITFDDSETPKVGFVA